MTNQRMEYRVCRLAIVTDANSLGDSEALWIEIMISTKNLPPPIKSYMELLSAGLGCPVILSVSRLNHESEQSSVCRAITEATHEIPTGCCMVCLTKRARLVPRFFCGPSNRMMKLPTTEYDCGRYCWDCLKNNLHLRYDLRSPIEGFGYDCPSCFSPLPIWVVDVCLRDSESIKR